MDSSLTLKEIAERADVSIATVSRCLNGSTLVAARTRARILKVIEDTEREESEPNQHGTIGVILPDNYDLLHINLYHASLHNHLRRTLEREEMDLLVAFARNRANGSSNIEALVGRNKVDGLILVLPTIDSRGEEFLRESGVPYVYSHYPPDAGHNSIDAVFVDHERGGMLVGEFLGRRVCCTIAAFHAVNGEFEFEQRTKGFQKGLIVSGYRGELRELQGEASYESGFALASDPQNGLGSANAIFALNDLMAFGIIQGLQARGIRVPQDVVVVGYDDTPLAGTFRPLLTTVKQPAQEVAFMTCERLIQVIEDRNAGREHEPRHITLQPNLVVRESAPW